jgi:hypothetical protein
MVATQKRTACVIVLQFCNIVTIHCLCGQERNVMTTEFSGRSHKTDSDRDSPRVYRLIDTNQVEILNGGVLPVTGDALRHALSIGLEALQHQRLRDTRHGVQVYHAAPPKAELGVVALPGGTLTEFIKIGDMLMLPVTRVEGRVEPAAVDTNARHSEVVMWAGRISGELLSMADRHRAEILVDAAKSDLVMSTIPTKAAESAVDAPMSADEAELTGHIFAGIVSQDGMGGAPASGDTHAYSLDQLPDVAAAVNVIAGLSPGAPGW